MSCPVRGGWSPTRPTRQGSSRHVSAGARAQPRQEVGADADRAAGCAAVITRRLGGGSRGGGRSGDGSHSRRRCRGRRGDGGVGPFGSVGTSTTGRAPARSTAWRVRCWTGSPVRRWCPGRRGPPPELSCRYAGTARSSHLRMSRRHVRGPGEASLLSAELSSDAEVLPTPERVPARCGVRFDGELELLAPDAESEALEPVDPADPVVSAKAIGIAEMPEPTPRATARGHPRARWQAYPGAASVPSQPAGCIRLRAPGLWTNDDDGH